MRWSDKIPFYKALESKGKIKPEDLMPDSNDGDALLMGIFSELSSARQIGMGVGPIPINILWDAQQRYGLTDAALHCLQHLDMEFVRQNVSHS